MEKLKSIIENYGRWSKYKTDCISIETFVETNFAIAIESSKSLVEAICKTILDDQKIFYSKSDSVQKLMTKTINVFDFSNFSGELKQFGRSLVNIAKNLSEIRNEIAIVSHGRSLHDIDEEKIDKIAALFLINSVETVACFLIEYYENVLYPKTNFEEAEIKYDDNEEFNQNFDMLYGHIIIGKYNFLPSEILFNLDFTAYKSEYQKYQGSRDGTDREQD